MILTSAPRAGHSKSQRDGYERRNNGMSSSAPEVIHEPMPARRCFHTGDRMVPFAAAAWYEQHAES